MTLQCSQLSNRYGTSGYVSNSIYSAKSNKSYYSGRYCSYIKLEHYPVIKPLTEIKGEFHIQEDKVVTSLRAYGIRIQLDATVNLKLPNPKDPKKLLEKVEGLFEGCSRAGNADYVQAPARSRTHISLKPGLNVYPFSLTFPEEPLPSPFWSQYGYLTYQIVAYIQTWTDYYFELALTTLRFKGYNNLSDDICASKPVSIKFELSFQKSMFSSKKSFTEVGLIVEKRGFLPGEKLPFKLTICNENCFLVQEVRVNFIRRTTYRHATKGVSRVVLDVIDGFLNQEGKNDPNVFYKGLLTIPKNCVPTYDLKPVYSVNYFVQYHLTVAEFTGHHGPVKGEVEVIIGTTNGPLEGKALVTRRRNTLPSDSSGQVGSSGPERSESTSSRLSDSSLMTNSVSLPPAYSELPSREMSILSLETLPPDYEDIT